MQNTVHFILQGKGGIGKTLVSTILAQWIASKDVAEGAQPLRCYDTDQENATFSRYKAMAVKHVPVMTDSRNIDPKRFDALMIDILEQVGLSAIGQVEIPSVTSSQQPCRTSRQVRITRDTSLARPRVRGTPAGT